MNTYLKCYLPILKNISISLIVLVVLAVVLAGCEKEKRTRTNPDPPAGSLEPNAITSVLVVPGAQMVEGNMPEPTNTPQSPDMTMVDSTVSYTAGSYVRLPIEYSDNSGSGISGIAFQVNGADSYIDVPVIAGNSGVMLLPIGIPSNTDEGKFCITIAIYDNDNNVSNAFETCITVTRPLGCNVTKVSGGEGVTSTLHNMGANPGMVKIEYETFTVPDRIDVFYNGIWVAGTGSNPGSVGSIPPLADCSNPTEGYIGDNGTFCFTYDPENFKSTLLKSGPLKSLHLPSALLNLQDTAHFVEVVVSGCVRGGTLWEYTISCADPDEECSLGQEGSPRFNLQFDGDVDFDLYVIDPNGEQIYWGHQYSASGGTLDVDCICCDHGNENIYWISGTAPNGVYEYWVDFFGDCSDNSSSFTITITSNGNVISAQTGSLSSVGSESQHWFYTHPSQGGGNNAPPSAAFGSSTVTGGLPLTVNFTDQSTNNPTSWLWQFGDGSTSNQRNPSHTYTQLGNFTVQLQVTNAYGTDTELKIDFITVTTGAGGGGDGEPCPGSPTMTDIDGNVYNTVQIGNQCWMKENLRVTRYADGTGLSIVSGANDWINLGYVGKAYCYCENSISNGEVYGPLYNWAATMNGELSSSSNPSGVQGICPIGWHIPSDNEWKQLEMHLGLTQTEANVIGWRGTNEGGKLKAIMLWDNPNTGATNSSEFTALPGGNRSASSSFTQLNYSSGFWSATEHSSISSWYRYLSTYEARAKREMTNKGYGFSVRCVKD